MKLWIVYFVGLIIVCASIGMLSHVEYGFLMFGIGLIFSAIAMAMINYLTVED
jgi:tellurite resistance protein TehA-like permease